MIKWLIRGITQNKNKSYENAFRVNTIKNTKNKLNSLNWNKVKFPKKQIKVKINRYEIALSDNFI